jgi:hypothetical protein
MEYLAAMFHLTDPRRSGMVKPETAARRPSHDIPSVSHGLWSLWDMITFRIKPFLDIQDTLTRLAQLIGSQHSKFYPRVNEKARNDMKRHLAGIMPELALDEFSMCRKGAERLINTIENTDDARAILENVQDLRKRLLDQSEATYCLLLSPMEKRLYESTESPLGAEVEKNFPSANEDIYEAAKCLALNRSTAAVMHLMRVCEVGLKALAAKLNVTSQSDWGAYIREIEKELAARVKAVGRRSADEQFYSEAVTSFDHLKRAWRNPSMHVEKTYSLSRAKEIYDAVKSFMSHLATKISEAP